MEQLGDVAHVESHSVHLETVLVLEQYMCMVCVKRTIGLEIVLDALDGTLMLRGSSESSFRLFWR
jgi:hypothetical protein